MAKLPYEEYESLLLDEDSDEDEILKYSLIRQGEGSFDWIIVPDPAKVDIPATELENESLMGLASTFFRKRRQRRFRKQMKSKPDSSVLVSEGDSWFQFPLLIKETIDHISEDYAIWSVGAAGDTAANMIFGPDKKYKTEYMRALRRQKDKVKAFLFSAAGNDIIGEDPETNESALFNILNNFNGDLSDINGHINFTVLRERIAELKRGYQTVIGNIRSEEGLESLPILIHGYDYVYPFPFGDNDTRSPIYAAKDQWLGKPLKKRNIPTSLGHEAIKVMIDELYDMMAELAGDSNSTNVWLVDCRGAMPDLENWADEIHGKSSGFKAVADRFKQVLVANNIH